MKIINKIIIAFIGILFIFSGLVKLNDPVGTGIKMEEYFDVFATDIASVFHILIPYSLWIGFFIVLAEVILGVALLLNFRMKDTIKILFALIAFFTFLTFYSAYFNKVTDCGCFGDAIPLTPWQSFSKDVILSVLIITLLAQLKSFDNTTTKISSGFVWGTLIVGAFLGNYAIDHLPFIDFRPYKVGNHIPTLMLPEQNCEYLYIMEKDGKEFTFDEYPENTAFKFKEMIITNPEKCTPKIVDFNVSDDNGNDFTETALTGKKIIIIIDGTETSNIESYTKLNTLLKNLDGELEPIILTSDSKIDALRHKVQLAVPYYFTDATVLKAMVRSNPGILLWQDGTVKGKWHFNDIPTKEMVLKLL